MVWKFGRKKANGRREKPPRRASDGRVASKTDIANHCSYEEAIAAVERLGFDGVGYCPTADDPFCLLDFDDAYDNGAVVPDAQPYVDTLNCYLEPSPSGTGLRGVVKATLNGAGTHVTDTQWGGDFEAYDRDGFLTITFQPLNGVLEPPPRQAELEAVIQELAPARSQPAVGDWLADARKNPKFRMLHDEGDTSDYESASEAALAYLNLLKLHLGHDFLAIDRAFQSGAMNEVEPKWANRRDWMLRTLGAAFTDDSEQIRQTKRPTEIHSDAMYGLAGDYVSLVEPYTEASMPAMLIQFLALAGNAMGRRPAWKIGGDRHTTNLYVAIVGDTGGGRKGTSYRKANWPIVLADPTWDDRKRSGISTGEGLLQMLQYEQMIEAETADPNSFKAMNLGRRLMMYQPEFAVVLKKMRRSESILSAILRDLWDRGKGGNWTVKNPIQVDGAHLSLITHIPELELSQELVTLDMANGFCNRFLWICSERSKFLPFAFETDLPEEQLEPIVERLKQAFDFARRQAPEAYQFDPEVREAWPDTYMQLEQPDPTLLGAVTSRATPNVMRLAVVYAVLDQSPILRIEHLNAALAVWDFSKRSAEYLFGSSLGNPTADRIYRFVLQHPTGVARKDIMTQLFANNASKAEIDEALQLLKDRGLMRKLDVPKKGPGRPPEVWQASTHSPPGSGDPQ